MQTHSNTKSIDHNPKSKRNRNRSRNGRIHRARRNRPLTWRCGDYPEPTAYMAAAPGGFLIKITNDSKLLHYRIVQTPPALSVMEIYALAEKLSREWVRDNMPPGAIVRVRSAKEMRQQFGDYERKTPLSFVGGLGAL